MPRRGRCRSERRLRSLRAARGPAGALDPAPGAVGLLLGALLAVLAAALGSVGLAFGLGGRAVAEGLNAGRVVHGAFELGQTIEVAGIRGEVIAFEPVATVVRKGAGSTVRIPNHLLVAEPVTTEERDSGPGDSAAKPDPSP